MTSRSLHRGFTLIELLLVIGVITILTGIVIVSVNPTKQLADARNAQRRSDLNVILDAVYQYSIDNNGSLPHTITTIETEICKSGLNVDCMGMINLNLLTGAYLSGLPYDPSASTENSTKYTIVKSGNRVALRAPEAELGMTIFITR